MFPTSPYHDYPALEVVEAALVDIRPPHLVARLVCATAVYCRIGGIVIA